MQDTLAVHRGNTESRKTKIGGATIEAIFSSLQPQLRSFRRHRSCVPGGLNYCSFAMFIARNKKQDQPQTINCYALAYSIMYLRHYPRLDFLS